VLRVAEAQESHVALVRPKLSASLNDILFAPGRSLWAIVEGLILNQTFVSCSWLSPYMNWGIWEAQDLILAASFSLSCVFVSLGLGQYERVRRYSTVKILINTFLAILFAAMAALSVTYFLAYGVFGRLSLVWGALGSFSALLIFRLSLAAFFRRNPYRFTTIGTSDLMSSIVELLSNRNNRESRYFQLVPCNESKLDGETFDDLEKKGIYDVVVSKEMLEKSLSLDFILNAMKHGIRLIHEEHFYQELFECTPLSRMSPATMIGGELNVRDLVYDALKRVIDVSSSLIALLLLSPLFILTAIAIKLTSRGNVIFVQPRQGRYGKPFQMYKFRTMRNDDSCAFASKGFTRKNDERVTLIGKILRPLHLDELPQLWNILRGDMSLVGPRPEALVFAKRMSNEIELYDTRYIVRPGLTGHAQLLAGYMMDTAEDTRKKLAYDLYYIKHQSLLLDIRILVRTVFVVIKKLL
jgi:exopolysaccharide biosynthesis polyprenyl glycosylphosphotransferase